ncbi:hypothetical protein Tco_0678524 [Tanacetum coccineum]|uniref:Uncharacterized protein n=1 Tax=Tanacetum coccineum TaxID=301880 RepID=A0ABQ4XFB6_9ASTR
MLFSSPFLSLMNCCVQRIKEEEEDYAQTAVCKNSLDEKKKAYTRVMTGELFPSVFNIWSSDKHKMECVLLHSLVAENETRSRYYYEDFDQGLKCKDCDDKARYSAFKVTEVKSDEPKALVSVDSMVNWSDHAAENKTGEVEKVYGMMAGLHAENSGADASGC